jgi:dephospho-CoA kinase
MCPALVLCFSGRMGSGKSSVTKVVADALQWQRVSFGDYVRNCVSSAGGDPESRETLQDFGQRLATNDPDGFCRAVLQSREFAAGANLVVDGIRHVDIYARISRMVAPSKAILLYLTVDDVELQRRIEARQEKVLEIQRAERHNVESDVVSSLAGMADLIVDASPPANQIARTIIQSLSNYGLDSAIIEETLQALR